MNGQHENRIKGLLVIVSCGRGKIWSRCPDHGPIAACDPYTAPPFKVNRQYAEHFAKTRLILSAKFGFIDPGWKLFHNVARAGNEHADGLLCVDVQGTGDSR